MSLVPKIMFKIDTARKSGRGILLGMARYCHLTRQLKISRGAPPYRYVGSEEQLDAMPSNWVADGFIVPFIKIPEQILELGLPIISAEENVQLKGMPTMIANEKQIARIATEHFLARGFKHFAYCGFQGIPWSSKRKNCYKQQLREAGFKINVYEQPELTSDFSLEDSLTRIKEWLQSLPKPLALLACNDDFGSQLTLVCQDAGFRVPDDIAILGIDNDEMVCLTCEPPLSSVDLDFEKAGFEAAEILCQMIQRKKTVNRKILIEPTNIITRQSTDILAVSDEQVSGALRFIRERHREPIQVRNVVEAMTTSRRALEYHFRKVLGCSINDEIRRSKVGLIARMLLTTNLSIAQIARELGYSDSAHIARYFRRKMGMSPQAYRKTHTT